MRIEAAIIKKLVGINKDGQLVHLPNQVLRKLKGPDVQDSMNKNSICIVCNYSFQQKTRGWTENIQGICHPFKDTSIFPNNKKLHLLSESDFCDKIWIDDGGTYKKKYDYMAFTIDTTQGIKCKGYHTLPLICKVGELLGLKGLILDYYKEYGKKKKPSYRNDKKGSLGYAVRKTRKRLRACEKTGSVDIKRGLYSQSDVSRMIKSSNFVIFPNTRDASPRTITETLLRGVPVMVNKNIFGGWKYVNDTNGILFDGPTSFLDGKQEEKKQQYYYNEVYKSMQYMSQTKFDRDAIIKKYYSKYGFFNSARRLANVINQIEGQDRYLYVFYEKFGCLLKQRWKRWHNEN